MDENNPVTKTLVENQLASGEIYNNFGDEIYNAKNMLVMYGVDPSLFGKQTPLPEAVKYLLYDVLFFCSSKGIDANEIFKESLKMHEDALIRSSPSN